MKSAPGEEARPVRRLLYPCQALLAVTGLLYILWFYPDRYGVQGPPALVSASTLIWLHALVGLVVLLLFGAILATHVRDRIRHSRNRVLGLSLLASTGLLVVTGFALQYSAAPAFREASALLHIALGILWLILIFPHASRRNL